MPRGKPRGIFSTIPAPTALYAIACNLPPHRDSRYTPRSRSRCCVAPPCLRSNLFPRTLRPTIAPSPPVLSQTLRAQLHSSPRSASDCNSEIGSESVHGLDPISGRQFPALFNLNAGFPQNLVHTLTHHHSPILRCAHHMIHQHRYIVTFVDVTTSHPLSSHPTKPKQASGN